RAAFAVPDLLAVHRADRCYFGGGAAHEDLVGEVKVFAGQVAFDHGNAVVARQRDDGIAGDAVEERGADRRGVQRAVENEEHVFARAFTEQSGGRERDAFAEAALARFTRDQLAGQIIARGLCARGNRVGRKALPARHARGNASLQGFRSEVRTHRPTGDGQADRRVRGDAETAESAERARTQVGLFEAVLLQDFVAGGGGFLDGKRQRHVVDARRVVQALHVRGEPENRAALRRLVAANAFEHRR